MDEGPKKTTATTSRQISELSNAQPPAANPKGRIRLRPRWVVFVIALLLLIFQRDFIWPPAFHWLANRALFDHHPENAMRWLNLAEWWGSQRADTALMRVRAARQIGDPALIINSMHQAEQRGADNLELQRERILCAAQSGQMSIAGPHLASLLTDADYDNKDVCRAYIAGYLRVQKLNEASSLIESLILDSPEDPWPWIVKGRISLLRSDLSTAESNFREACRRDSSNMEAIVFLAEVLKDSRQIDEAMPYFKQAMTDHEQQLRAAIGLSQCLTSSGNPDEAIRILKEAVAIYPADANVLLELGRSQFEDGDYPTASVTLEKAVSVRPWSDEGHYLLAQCLQASNRNEEAKSHFDFVKSARKAHSELNELQDRVSKSPNDDRLLLRISVLLTQFGDPQEAIAVLHSAIDINPTNQEARELLHDILAKQTVKRPDADDQAGLHGRISAPNSSKATDESHPKP